MPSEPSKDELIAPLEAFSHLDEVNRLRLQDGLYEAAEALETPVDMMYRLLNQVCPSIRPRITIKYPKVNTQLTQTRPDKWQ